MNSIALTIIAITTKILLICCLSGFFSGQLYAQSTTSHSSIEQDLINKIAQSKKRLEKETKAILKEKKDYAQRLKKAQNSVKALTEQAKGLQRLADEKLLSLESMKARAEKWEEQINYQSHLLTTYTQIIATEQPELDTNSDSNFPEIEALMSSVDKIEELLAPTWKKDKIAIPTGDIIEADVINIGPNHWYIDSTNQSAGLYKKNLLSNEKSAYYELTSGQYTQFIPLMESNQGHIVFDPTMGRAIELAENQETMMTHINKGGVWVLPIIIFGFISLFVSILKSIQLYQLPTYTPDVLRKLEKLVKLKLEDGTKQLNTLIEDVKDPLYRMAITVLKSPPSDQREDTLFSQLNSERHRVERFLDVISMTAAVAPLLGLLGTVSGMIETFKMLTIFGSGDPAAISGGISEALVTTELGLIVAIPSLIINALLSRKVKSHMHCLETNAIKLNNASS